MEPDISELEAGQVAIVEPFDDVKLEFHGLSDEDACPLLIYAIVERDGGDSMLLYKILGISPDEKSFRAVPDRLRNKRAEEAIEEVGGEIRTRASA